MILLGVAACVLGGQALAAVLPTAVRGGRAILLQPEPGPLTIRILKRDLNIYDGPDELTAQLFDPQRRPIGTLALPDDGSAGKTGLAKEPQSGEIKVQCEMPGVYRLAIVCSGDLIFGVDTTCKRIVAEGDILLNDGGLSGDVVFQPPPGAFTITAQALHVPGIQNLPLLDAKGAVVHTFDLAKAAEDKVFQAPAGDRDGLWRFRVAKMDVKLLVQGAPLWTTDAAAYFAADRTKWMLLPHCETRYLPPGGSAEMVYTLRNRTGKTARFALGVRPEAESHTLQGVGLPVQKAVVASSRPGAGIQCQVTEPGPSVELKKDEARIVRVLVRAARDAQVGGTLRGFLSASAVDDPDATQSAGIEVRVGESPVARPLATPIVLQRYRHENALFGYAPDYVANEVYFDLRNRPFIRERTESAYRTTAITFLDGGRWVERPFVPALEKALPGYRGIYFGGGFLGAKIAFDGDSAAYTLLSAITPDKRRRTVLLYTPDDGQTYTVHELPGESFDIEQFTGHNALKHPPPVLAYRRTANRPERFASVNDLLLFMPTKDGGKLTLGEPVLVSKQCLGSCQHSGAPASTATRDGQTHIVWGEVTDEKVDGVPTYVATYDHASRKVGEKVFLAHAPPINDVHNVPGICLDSEGYLHVVAGAHGQPFKYTRSLKPNDAYSGWTKPVEV
ncbi:MAG: hypothetical protein FJ279_14585, partial [Planctomycetes bacterium]|nr:hypothetical protein [Planctomycetota bacterium]